MLFLLLNQFYPPDPAPTGRYLHDLARTLVSRGHEVKVLCSRRSYNGVDTFPARETLDGVEILRLPATGFGRRGFVGKLTDYATFYGSLFATLMSKHGKAAVILSLTTPPYIGLLGKWAAWWHGCRHAHWIMDLYPDVMFAHGMTRKSGPVFRVLQKLTRFQFRGSQFTLALGPMMGKKVDFYQISLVRRSSPSAKEETLNPQPSPSPSLKGRVGGRMPSAEPSSTLNSQPSTLNPLVPPLPALPVHQSLGDGGCPLPSVFWLPLWSNSKLSPWPDQEPNLLRSERGWKENEPVFLYSGNMGLGHRFEEFLEVAKRLGSSGPRWVFAGDGKRRSEIVAFAKSNPLARIEIIDYAPDSILRAHLCAADVHLASLDSSWQGLMVPSKLQGSFAVGRPVLYVGDRQCETAAWIEESGGGWIVPENDIEGLVHAVKQACDPQQFRARGTAAWRFAQTHFKMSTNCTRIAELLESAALNS